MTNWGKSDKFRPFPSPLYIIIKNISRLIGNSVNHFGPLKIRVHLTIYIMNVKRGYGGAGVWLLGCDVNFKIFEEGGMMGEGGLTRRKFRNKYPFTLISSRFLASCLTARSYWTRTRLLSGNSKLNRRKQLIKSIDNIYIKFLPINNTK